MDAEALKPAGIWIGLGQEAAPVTCRLADPARQEPGVLRVERVLELLDPAPVLAERTSELGRIVKEYVDPDPRVRSRDSRHVPKRAARSGQRFVSVDPDRAGVVEKEV